jgi:hypothetical protein
MSYIINNTSELISIKLTEKGREQLAKGSLNFSYWAIGDSEINYEREAIVDANPTDPVLSGSSRILRPKDQQPNIKYFISTGATEFFTPLTDANINTLKVIVNNEADERGFFSGDTVSGFTTLTSSPYALSDGLILDSTISGGTSLDLGVTGVSVGDLILLKLSNDTLGTVSTNTNLEPIPHLFYKVETASGTSVTVDRALPNLTGSGGTAIQYIVYASGEVYDTIGSGNTTSYWNTNTLSFDSSCNISIDDVPVWNLNNVWCEDLVGMSGGTHEDHTKFGSYQYLGQKYPFFEYDCLVSSADTSVKCEGLSEPDGTKKSIAVIHYTNNTISNFYGEFFHIDNSSDKTVRLHLPDLMYHRRSFTGGTATGDEMGMSFLASGGTKFIGSSDIEYVDLIEDPDFVSDTPQVVGKVFPQLKVVVIDDDELVTTMSYKSNRNWTLPPLTATLKNSDLGLSAGVLNQNETMYLTYILENSTGTGLTTTAPCQKYAKVTNSTSVSKDVEFKLQNVDLLPYMRKIEDVGYDGRGFYGYDFKVLYQIVSDDSDRPDPSAWKEIDYTTSGLTGGVSGETIDPIQLESQSPANNDFVITSADTSGATVFDLVTTLSLPPNVSPDLLQFGDERFFYGNIETYIGATIYKTIFDLRVNSGQFITTTNPTRNNDISTNPPDLRVSEVAIYDDLFNLVVIGKTSKPVNLTAGDTIMLGLSMDF